MAAPPADAPGCAPRAIPASTGASDVAALGRAIEALGRAHPTLTARSPDSIVAALAAVVEAWLAPGSPWMADAERLLPPATGFAPQMIRDGLPLLLAPLRAPALAELLAAEAGDRAGPPLILHVLPGNLPGLAAVSAALSLAVRSTALLKPGAGDQVFPALFAASIAAQDAALGACVAVHYWRGGDRRCEDIALRAADLVVAAGDDATIASLRERTRARFIGHGHRLSFAVIARETAADERAASTAAERLAVDVALWDQRGCLSPQACFVEGDLDAALAFGARVAAALEPLAAHWPPARATLAERLDIRRFRDAAEWRQLGGGGGACFATASELGGTVVVDPVAALRPTPLGRSLRVMPIADLRHLPELLAPARSALEGAGVAAPAERAWIIAADLSAAGAHRVSPVGEMQRPPLSWRQGGRPRLAEWISSP